MRVADQRRYCPGQSEKDFACNHICLEYPQIFCGIGPAIDSEDGPKGFGAHSDQERILESELHRFVRFQYDVVLELARRR